MESEFVGVSGAVAPTQDIELVVLTVFLGFLVLVSDCKSSLTSFNCERVRFRLLTCLRGLDSSEENGTRFDSPEAEAAGEE